MLETQVVKNHARREQRPSLTPFLECNDQDEVLGLEAQLVQLLVHDLCLNTRNYDEAASAFYAGRKPMADRTEPVMIAKWSNRVELDAGLASRMRDSVPGSKLLGSVLKDGELKTIVGDPTTDHSQGIRVIIRGDGVVQREVTETIEAFGDRMEALLPQDGEPVSDTKTGSGSLNHPEGMIANFQALDAHNSGQEEDVLIFTIGARVNRRAGDLVFSDLTPN